MEKSLDMGWWWYIEQKKMVSLFEYRFGQVHLKLYVTFIYGIQNVSGYGENKLFAFDASSHLLCALCNCF